jgi:hypothetical protein
LFIARKKEEDELGVLTIFFFHLQVEPLEASGGKKDVRPCICLYIDSIFTWIVTRRPVRRHANMPSKKRRLAQLEGEKKKLSKHQVHLLLFFWQ